MTAPDHQSLAAPWQNDLAVLLEELSSVQQELLEVLVKKRDNIAAGDLEGMSALEPREQELAERLEQCHQRRAQLLSSAQQELEAPIPSLGKLAALAPAVNRERVRKQVKQASERMRILQHHSLANWVLAQRTLLHLAQMLEIIATGGRFVPTYGSDKSLSTRGALVDEEV